MIRPELAKIVVNKDVCTLCLAVELLSESILAIDGGQPVFPDGPPQWPIADDSVLNSVRTAMADGSWGAYEARWTDELAVQLSKLTNREHVFLCSSGTIAVEIALRAVDVKPGSEVILAAYDFPGNFRAIESIGARPVIVDVVDGGWVMSPEECESAISNETSAIIISHLHGQVADLNAFETICKKHNLHLIEDACQTPGGYIDGKPLGSFGDVSVFSFGGSKLLSAGRGGAVVTGSPDFFQRAKIYCNRGNEAFPLSQLQAAALLPQLELLNSRNSTRLERVQQLLTALEPIRVLKPLQQVVDANIESSFYKLPWLIETTGNDWTRNEFINAIQAEGVSIDAGFRGFTRRSVKRCRQHGSLINSRIAAQQTLILHHPILLESETMVQLAAEAITKVACSRN